MSNNTAPLSARLLWLFIRTVVVVGIGLVAWLAVWLPRELGHNVSTLERLADPAQTSRIMGELIESSGAGDCYTVCYSFIPNSAAGTIKAKNDLSQKEYEKIKDSKNQLEIVFLRDDPQFNYLSVSGSYLRTHLRDNRAGIVFGRALWGLVVIWMYWLIFGHRGSPITNGHIGCFTGSKHCSNSQYGTTTSMTTLHYEGYPISLALPYHTSSLTAYQCPRCGEAMRLRVKNVLWFRCLVILRATGIFVFIAPWFFLIQLHPLATPLVAGGIVAAFMLLMLCVLCGGWLRPEFRHLVSVEGAKLLWSTKNPNGSTTECHSHVPVFVR